MFNGFSSRKVNSTFELNKIETQAYSLGAVNRISENRFIYKKSDAFYDQEVVFSLNKRESGDLMLNTQYKFNPSILSWIIGICFFPIGFLAFIFAYNAKNDFESFLHSFLFEL
tara:strand:+ start:306 stop:644 length:339 start_codon:yes stop_codon:yes gene_type:complete